MADKVERNRQCFTYHLPHAQLAHSSHVLLYNNIRSLCAVISIKGNLDERVYHYGV